MANVSFTSALRRFYPDLKPQHIPANTLAEVLEELDRRYPGLRDYLVDERGRLRRHVNIYIGETLAVDRDGLGDRLDPDDDVLIFQALSGG